MSMILLQQFLMYGILAIGLQIAMNAGVFSLASIGFWGIGSYVTAYAVLHGVPWGVGMLLAITASILIGIGIAVVTRRLGGLYLGMVTIAFDLLIVTIANNWTEVTGGPNGLYGIPPLLPVWGLAILFVIACIMGWQFSRGALRRSTDVLRSDKQLERAFVPDNRSLRVVIFTVSGALGALSGAANAISFYAVSPRDSGFALVVLALTMVILGGVSRWWGAVIGCLIVVWLPEQLRFLDNWRTLAFGAVTVLIVVFFPGGLAGLIERVIGLVRHRGEAKRGQPA